MNIFIKIIKGFEIIAILMLGFIFVAAIADMEFGTIIKSFLFVGPVISLLYLAYGFAQLICTLSSKSDNKNIGLSIVKLLSANVLNISVTSCYFMLNHYPGGSIMLYVGTLLGVIFTIILLALKEMKTEGMKLAPRIVIAIILAIVIRANWNLLTPYHANEALMESLCYSPKMKEPLSEKDAAIVAAWYDINQGINKDKALKIYGLSEAEYNEKADALVYGGADKIPQNRKVEIVPNNNGYCEVDKMVSPDDTAYVHSLRPIYYQLFDNERLKEAIDMDNLAKHTDNIEFKEYVKQEYSAELMLLKDLPYIE